MKATLSLPRRATYADYLSAQQGSEGRLELIDGVIVAMAGGSVEHNAISGRFAGLFAARLPPGCLYYTPDQRFWIAGTARGRYADGSVVCGRPEHPAHDSQAATNPRVILEVLSPSTEGDDDGEKRRDFQSLPSLRAYLLAAQDAREIRVYQRDQQGAWHASPVTYRSGDEFEIQGLSGSVRVDEVYDGILDPAGRSVLS